MNAATLRLLVALKRANKCQKQTSLDCQIQASLAPVANALIIGPKHWNNLLSLHVFSGQDASGSSVLSHNDAPQRLAMFPLRSQPLGQPKVKTSPLTSWNGHLFSIDGLRQTALGAGAACCGATGGEAVVALGEALHSSFSPNAATWVVNRLNVPAQAFLCKISSLTGEA